MSITVDFNSGGVNAEQPLIPPSPVATPAYQRLVDAASDIGQKILNNPIVASCDRDSVIKAALIVGTGLAITGIYLGTRALFPNDVTVPYVFSGLLIFGGLGICATRSNPQY